MMSKFTEPREQWTVTELETEMQRLKRKRDELEQQRQKATQRLRLVLDVVLFCLFWAGLIGALALVWGR